MAPVSPGQGPRGVPAAPLRLCSLLFEAPWLTPRATSPCGAFIPQSSPRIYGLAGESGLSLFQHDGAASIGGPDSPNRCPPRTKDAAESCAVILILGDATSAPSRNTIVAQGFEKGRLTVLVVSLLQATSLQFTLGKWNP